MDRKRYGFTLLELLGVIAVIAILMGLGLKGFSTAQRKAKTGRAKGDIENIRIALDEYRVEFGRYPVQDPAGPVSDLDADVLDFFESVVENLELTDPWENPYYYGRKAGSAERFKYRIWSLGLDGRGSTTVPDSGSEADVDNISPSIKGY